MPNFQQIFCDFIHKIYDPQPVNTDLQYRLIQFVKIKTEELNDLNDIIQREDSVDAFDKHDQAIEGLTAMRNELTNIIIGMDKAVEGAKEEHKKWQAEEVEDPGYSIRNEIRAINRENGFY